MKRLLSLLLVLFAFGFSSLAIDAQAAKRMGAGKSMGTQRQVSPDKSNAAPAQSAVAAPAAAAAPSRSWMGPVAGLAAGLGLAALASHLGLGSELASLLLIGLLAAAIMVAIGFFMRKRATSTAGNRSGMHYAYASAAGPGGATQPERANYKTSMPAAAGTASTAIGSAIGAGIGADLNKGRIPEGFDTENFARQAKVNFLRLQTAHDAGNVDELRQFTTPEMLAQLQRDIMQREGATLHSEVIHLEARVIDFDEGTDGYVVSVRFNGLIRYEAELADESFDETWHLTKSRQGTGGWILAGIEQLH